MTARGRGNPIPTAIRVAVDARDGRQCQRCGTGRGREIHHRVRRRDGGHLLDVVILLCGACHRWAHSHPTEAKRTGFIVAPWDNAEEVPVRTYRGWITLADDGSYAFIGAPTDDDELEYR